MSGHPMRRLKNWKKRAVPIALHGDVVPTTGVGKTWAKGMMIITFCSLVALGAVWEMNFPIFLMFKPLLFDGDGSPEDSTRHHLWNAICWSFAEGYKGRFPEYDWNNNPLGANTQAGRKKGEYFAVSEFGYMFLVLWILRGDLEWYWDEFGFPRWNTQNPCHWCCCNRTNRPWNDFKPTAAWLGTIYTTASFLAANPRHHRIYTCQPGMSILALSVDFMHTLYLGIWMYFYGSVLQMLVRSILPGDIKVNMGVVWAACKEYFKQHKVADHFGNIYVGMFYSEDAQPQLKGTAGEIRSLGPALLHVFKLYKDNGNELHNCVQMALEKAVAIDTALKNHRKVFRFPTDVARAFEQNVFDFLTLYTMAADLAPRYYDYPLFNITIKCHNLAHGAINAKYINPRLQWCWSGEDYMKWAKNIVASCVRGNNSYQVAGKILYNIYYALHIQASELEE